MQSKLIIYLSTNLSTTATSSRPAGSLLVLTSLPSNDSSRSINGACRTSVDNDSVYDNSVNNASVYTASVNSASVSKLHSPSMSLSRTLSSHTTFAEVMTLIRAIPTTIIPRTNLEQQQSLPNILTRPVSSGTSTVDHPQNPLSPSAPGIVSLGQPITNPQHNLNAN